MLILAIYIVDEALTLDDLLHERRECLTLELCSSSSVIDHTTVEINLHIIACLDSLSRFRALDDRKSDVDGIPIKYSGKCLCDYTAYS